VNFHFLSSLTQESLTTQVVVNLEFFCLTYYFKKI